MRIVFHGAAGTVTGSNHLLETAGGKLLVDCGMFQGPKELRTRNYLEFAYDPRAIDAVLVTHAHIDHTGLLPKLVKKGFNGPIYATHATAELMGVMLVDAAHIQDNDSSWENRKRKRSGQPLIEPLYTVEDVEKTMALVRQVNYRESFHLLPGMECVIRDAGHIMGSGFVELTVTENGFTKRLVLSGDLGRPHQAFISDPEVGERADLVMIESTYGNRRHKTEDDTNSELVAILQEVARDRGTLIIPAFAVGRTQEMVYRFFELADKNQIPPMKFFIDSPMAERVTKIYAENRDLYDPKTLEYLREGKNPLQLPNLSFVGSPQDSMALNETPGPKVIISASGMCDAGRVVHHLKHNIWQRNCHILFVGYQARGTLGRRLIEGAKKVSILGETLQVNAKIHTVGGLSAHADVDGMLAWLRFYRESNPTVLLVHGDPEATDGFSESIHEQLGLATFVPQWRDAAVLTFTRDGISVTMEKNPLFSRFAEEKTRWLDLSRSVNVYLDSLTDGPDGLDKTMFAEILLERLNAGLETLLEEYKADIRVEEK